MFNLVRLVLDRVSAIWTPLRRKTCARSFGPAGGSGRPNIL